MTSLTETRPAVRALPLVLDVVCVVAFAFGGKSSHEAGDSDWVVLAIAWPFVLACVLGHVALTLTGRRSERISPEGLAVVATTFVVGMVLRVASGRGIAVGFLVVAVIFLTVTMLGWRAVAVLVRRRRSPG